MLPSSDVVPGDPRDRLEQEFLKEQVGFVQKTIFLILRPSAAHNPAEVLAVAVGR